MKKILIFIGLLGFISCLKDPNDGVIRETEIITDGKKWTLQIGSTYEEVFAQLQTLGNEKNFSSVEIINRKTYASLEGIEDFWKYYNYLYLNKKGEIYPQRVIILCKDEKVSEIEIGGSLMASIERFPTDFSQEKAIQKEDTIERAYEKLADILKDSQYGNYELFFYHKDLQKPFDPDMKNYAQWYFAMSYSVNQNRKATSSVVLSFSDGKLSKMEHTYTETDVYN